MVRIEMRIRLEGIVRRAMVVEEGEDLLHKTDLGTETTVVFNERLFQL